MRTVRTQTHTVCLSVRRRCSQIKVVSETEMSHLVSQLVSQSVGGKRCKGRALFVGPMRHSSEEEPFKLTLGGGVWLLNARWYSSSAKDYGYYWPNTFLGYLYLYGTVEVGYRNIVFFWQMVCLFFLISMRLYVLFCDKVLDICTMNTIKIHLQ